MRPAPTCQRCGERCSTIVGTDGRPSTWEAAGIPNAEIPRAIWLCSPCVEEIVDELAAVGRSGDSPAGLVDAGRSEA